MAIISAYKSDIGRNKDRQNEDYIWVDDETGLYIVADGMGGHEAGDIASELAATTIGNYISDRLRKRSEPLPTETVKAMMIDAAESANNKVYEAAKNLTQKRQMGTTVVAALVRSTTAYISHAGDSRAYLLRNSTLVQLTEDDSWGTFARQGSGSETTSSALDLVLTKAVGQHSSLDPSFTVVDLSPSDTIILCSDGLWSMVEVDQILAIVDKAGDKLDEAVEALIAAANEAGGSDNISVILVRNAS